MGHGWLRGVSNSSLAFRIEFKAFERKPNIYLVPANSRVNIHVSMLDSCVGRPARLAASAKTMSESPVGCLPASK